MGRVTRRHAVLRVAPGEAIRRNDTLAVEEPLEIRLNGESYLVTMRTPGNDIDLVHGLLYSERIITERSDIVLARYCAGSGPDGVNTYNVLDVTLAPQISAPAAAPAQRHDDQRMRYLRHHHRSTRYCASRRTRWTPRSRLRLSSFSRHRRGCDEHQRAFDQTGGLHAAGLLGLELGDGVRP